MIIPLDTDCDDDWIKMVRKLTAGQLTTKKIKTFDRKENLVLMHQNWQEKYDFKLLWQCFL